MCMSNALAKSTADFAACDPLAMAELSGAPFAANSFSLQYCGLLVAVEYPGGEMHLDSAYPPLRHNEKVLLLQYLSNACGLPPRGRWLSFLDLQGGPLHWTPFQREALWPLARQYNDRLDRFLEAGIRHGGERIKMGDAALIIPVLPRLSLVFIIWQGDSEFAPRSLVLYDAVAETYLPTATLYVLGIEAVIRIWFPGDSRFAGLTPP